MNFRSGATDSMPERIQVTQADQKAKTGNAETAKTGQR